MEGSVKIENPSKIFVSKNESVEALKDVNLELSAGSFVRLIGPSGNGKRTSHCFYNRLH